MHGRIAIDGLSNRTSLSEGEATTFLAILSSQYKELTFEEAGWFYTKNKSIVKSHLDNIYEKWEVIPATIKNLHTLLQIGFEEIQDGTFIAIAPVVNEKLPQISNLPIQSIFSYSVNWLEQSRQLLERQKHLATNILFRESIKNFDDVHVPLGLVERKERPNVTEEPSPEQGSQFYQPEDTAAQRYEHDDFLTEVIENRRAGKHIAIIGEPGAGKTTILIKIGAWLIEQAEQQPEKPLLVAWISLASLKQQDLSDYFYGSWLKSAHPAACPPKNWEDELKKLIMHRRVWLLLDGLDETSRSDAPTWLDEQLAGWGDNLRVVMTCRLNQWETSNDLVHTFEVYRTLDYSYQATNGEDQVHTFLTNWFKPNQKIANQIHTELHKPGKERIKDLVKNPLRLTLLCKSWKEGNQSLPETQADLYQSFVNYLYGWKEERFKEEFRREVNLKTKLNLALGELAKAGLNREPTNNVAVRRFQFTDLEISNLWGEQRSSILLPTAKKLGWLNVVGEENPHEDVYAFLHPTFQEYFAACNIDDSDYFLPKEHVDHPVNCQDESIPSYRIFRKQWQQVILLWIGRNNLNENCKDDFLKRATNFNDNESGIYFYISYCLAASYLSEFKKARQNLEITNKFSRWIAHDDETLDKSEAIGFIQATNSSGLNYTSHVFKCLYGLLVEIDELIKKHELDMFCSNKEAKTTSEKTIALDIETIRNQRENILNVFSIRSKISQRGNILKIFKLLPHLTTELYEYCWNFAKAEQLDLGSAYVCYQIIVKHAANYNVLSASELTNFKGSERYCEIRIIGTSNNRKRRLATRIKETPGFKEKTKKLEMLFENFSDFTDRPYCDKIIHVITDNENYSLYEVKQKILNAIQKNQALLEYLCELIDSSENREVKYKIATSLDIIDYCRIGNINKLVKLIEDVDSSSYLRHLLEKLHNVVFENIIFDNEEISEEEKEKIVKYLIGKLIREADERCFKVLARYIGRILTKEIIPFLISKLKIQLTDKTCDPKKIEGYYYLIAYCAQTLSYQAFYDMWHQSDNNPPPRNH